ncbi:MAG: endo-1,4-beta-xylanase [Rhizobiaceae bacterium]
MTRRAFVAGVMTAAIPVGTVAAGLPSMRDIGRSKGIDVGAAIATRSAEKYLAILRSQCSLITPEWQLKPRVLRAQADMAYNFGPADAVAAFAAANGQKLHGHSLYWNRQSIRWAEQGHEGDVRRAYGDFIRDVVSRYPQAVSWDVFNEVVSDREQLRSDTLPGRLGIGFVEFCYRVAQETSPAAKLAINDHSLECVGNWCGFKQTNMLRTLEALLKRGTPIHAVGIQGHLSSTWKPWGRRSARFIRRVGDLGLEVWISELDVNDSQFALNVARRDREVARYYEDFLGSVLAEKALKRVTFWGISDSDHWMLRVAGTGERRLRGRARPGLFDENDDPKPAFEAVLRALSEAPARG